MPVFITDDDALAKMMLVEVEGDSWLKEQERVGTQAHRTSFHVFKDVFLRDRDELADAPEHCIRNDDGDGAIYGFMGYNRYFVNSTGELFFSRNHSNHLAQDRAVAAGFRLR